MANNKYNESIEDKAFKALDEALQIDFSQETTPSHSGKTPDAPEAKLSDTPSARNQQPQDESQRRRGRSANAARTAEQAPRAPTFAPAMPTAIRRLPF
jgi:beta-phosphoglucomutase-like phosphatase (HAD superfamily)